MKRIFLGAVTLMMLAGVLPAGAEQVSLAYLQGWVVDEACGKQNAAEDSADCIVKCHKEKGSPLAFYSAERDELYRIEDQKQALAYVGREIKVLGVVNEDKGTIKIGSYIEKDAKNQVIGPPQKDDEKDGDGGS
jgi:hypothetical protein